MKHKKLRTLLTAIVAVPLFYGCGSSVSEPPAAPAVTKANIKGNSSLDPDQKQATLQGMDNAEINRQIRMTGKLPNGQTVPLNPPQPPPHK